MRSLLLVTSLFLVTACIPVGGDNTGTDTTPGGTDTSPGVDTASADTTTPPDTLLQGDTAPPPDTTSSCSRNGFGGRFVERVETFYDAEGAPSYSIFAVNDAESEPASTFQIEIYSGTGAPDGPGTWPISNLNYKDCLLCVRVRADCTADTGCPKTFLATSGVVEIDTWDATTFSGTVRNVEMIEVFIDESEGYLSTAVEGGETWCIDELPFSANFEAPPEATCDAGQPVFAPDTITADVIGSAAEVNRTIFLNAQAGTSPRDVLSLEMFELFGANIGPGSYTYTYQAYDDCSTCVTMSLGCTDDGSGNTTCADGEYLAVGGLIEIIAVGDAGDSFQGTLRDFEFYEHVFNEDYTTEPVENGRSYCVEAMPFNVTLELRQTEPTP